MSELLFWWKKAVHKDSLSLHSVQGLEDCLKSALEVNTKRNTLSHLSQLKMSISHNPP